MKIEISQVVSDVCPDLHVLMLRAKVTNSSYNADLWDEISKNETLIRNTSSIEHVNKIPPIVATRQAYKKLGKDPNRYRPSAESLLRRIHRNLPLYQINTLVDIVNLLSIKTGYSIGGFDAGKIVGDTLVLGVGREGELYHGIGRGELNIEGLPVYRDQIGGIGTPTSDEERTKIELETTDLLLLLNAYSGSSGLDDARVLAQTLLIRFCDAKDIYTAVFCSK